MSLLHEIRSTLEGHFDSGELSLRSVSNGRMIYRVNTKHSDTLSVTFALGLDRVSCSTATLDGLVIDTRYITSAESAVDAIRRVTSCHPSDYRECND